MKKERPRNLALRTLNGLVHRQSYSDNYLDDLFQRNRYLDNRDRAFISNLVQGVLRWRLRLDWVIGQFSDFPLKKIDSNVLNILRLAVFQILFLDRVPESAAVNEAVNQTKTDKRTRHVSPFVNGILRRICRQKDKVEFPDRDRDAAHRLSVFYSYPGWIVDKWVRSLGTDFTEDLLSAQNRISPLNLRVNGLEVSREGLIERLSREGITGRPTPYSPVGIIVEDYRGRADELAGFKEGLFQVQDQAAQITSCLLAPEPGDLVLDICAGFGGKSTHLAELMTGKGRIFALDISCKRLTSLVRNSRRLGFSNIHPVLADALGDLSSLFNAAFDRIMVDAPCSGLGVLSRHPDGKWNREEKDVKRLARMQKRILSKAASILRKGGRMLYVTCSISGEENEGVVRDLLKTNEDISLVDLRDHVPGWGLDLIDDQGFFKSFPNIHHMDGFFAALFTKK